MIGGIDQQIQQKVDAYRGNPQQLMQRYQQNQELIDLLALQKLKSEKDAAARQMQMQMQGNPQTIKDQREAEMLQRTKDDMVKQTSGIMQQRQQQQQKNMQRTANQGLPQLPAGNMQRMAGGGIVAFAEGGDVKAKVEEALQTGASLADIEKLLRGNPEALAYLRSRVQEAKKGEIPYGEEFDQPMSIAGMGERPAEGMRVPDRAPQIDTTDIMSLLGPKETVPSDRPPTVRLPEREPSEPSMGRAPAEARSIPSRAPMIDTTDLASLLGPTETRRPEKPEVPDTIVQDKIASMKGKLSPSLGSIDTSKLVRDMGVTPLSEKPDGVTGAMEKVRAPQGGPFTEQAQVNKELDQGREGGSGILGGIKDIFRQMQESAAKTPGGIVTEQAKINREMRGKEGPAGLYEETSTPTTTAPPTTTPDTTAPTAEQKRAQQMDQLQEIDTSGLAGLKKESMSPRELYEGYKSALGSTISEQQDPEKLARERQRAFRLGALSGGGRGGLAGAAAASGRAREAQEARKLQGIEKLMGAENLLMGMDADAAKLDVERESNQILNQIRQGQLTSQQMDSIRRTINDITESVMDSLTFDETYNGLQTRYQEAINDGNLETAKLVKQEMDTYLNSKLEAYPTYKAAMEEFKQLQTAQTGGASSGWGKPQIVAE